MCSGKALVDVLNRALRLLAGLANHLLAAFQVLDAIHVVLDTSVAPIQSDSWGSALCHAACFSGSKAVPAISNEEGARRGMGIAARCGSDSNFAPGGGRTLQQS